jgi:hypothetical protein
MKNLLAYTLTGPGIQPTNDPAKQVEDILSNVIGFLTIVAVIFFVIQIILAGYGFISGQGDEKKIETSRKKLTDGILGLTIVVVAFGVGAFISTLLGLQTTDGGSIFNLNSFINSLNSSSAGAGIGAGTPLRN